MIVRHILRIISEWKVIECIPDTLTRKRYLSIEEDVGSLADEASLNLGEMDLYLWYMATGGDVEVSLGRAFDACDGGD